MPTHWEKIRNFLLYLFVFLIPLQTVYILAERVIGGRKWQYGTMVIYATEILLWAIVIIQLWLLFKRHGFHFKIKLQLLEKRKRFLLIIGLWLLIAWSGLSIFWSSDQTLSVYYWFKLLEALAFFMVVITSNFDKIKMYWALALAGLLEGLTANLQFFKQEVVSNKLLGVAEHLPSIVGDSLVEYQGLWLRAYGHFSHPNILAGFLVLCFFVVLFLYLKEEPIFDRFLSPLQAVIMLVIASGIFFSFSRSAWLALILSYLFLLVSFKIKKVTVDWRQLSKITAYLFLLGLVISIIYQPFIFNRLSAQNNLEDISLNRRVKLLNQTYGIIGEKPLVGVGLGSYTSEIFQDYAGVSASENQPVHNLYLLITAELGLVGLAIFLFIVISVWRLAAQEGNYLFCSLIIAFLVIGFFDHYLWTQYSGLIIFWLTLALALKTKSYESLDSKH